MADNNSEINFLKKGKERNKADKSQSDESSNAKKPFIFIGIISLVALFLGFFQIYKNIYSPFQTKLSINSTSSLSDQQLNEIDSLKTKDTDSDGLSDYDELYFYNTSPYLKDSDSDGFEDKEEINSDNDPNCPAGIDCSGISGRTNTNTSNQNGNTNNTLITGQANTDSLRQTLKNAGVPQYMLENISDEELMEVYKQTINETSQTNVNANSNLNINNSNSSTSVSSNTNLPSNINTSELPEEEITNYLENLSADEIRSFLIEYGISEEELSGVDDETLKAVFLKALEEQEL